ncbi:Glycosyltransferase involved in cell wall bisynthesis [Eubacterium ruminantium]|nr:Glycosyltransferase involved in cell wall bisynthesis [Eubacterium ruminantium]
MEIKRKNDTDIILTILMPCLNEENAVGESVDEAERFLQDSGIPGEILIVDNASKDASAKVAEAHGARVIYEPRRGYGRAIRTGLSEMRGIAVMIGDCDTTYDFYHMKPMVKALLSGKYDMVIGDRFAGGIEKGAMPFSHRFGAGMLSFLARRFLHSKVRDFHCGLRGLTRDAVEKMDLRTDGMEFATEMIREAEKHHLRIAQGAVVLRKCTAERKSKLKTVRDGMRHLVYILKEWRQMRHK